MPKNLLILKFLYGRDRPSGFLASEEPLGRFFGINRMALGEHEVLSKSEGNRRLTHGKTKKTHPPRGGGRG
jgi:hypothetical protein